MQYYNNVLCITGPELIKSETNPHGLMSLSNYKKQAYTLKRLNILRPGKGEGSFALIEFTSLPAKYQRAAKEKFGDIEKVAKKRGIMEYLKKDPEAVKFFASYTIEYNDNTKGLSIEKQTEYVNNASILNALKSAWDEHVADRQKNGKRPLTTEFWSNAVEVLPSLMENEEWKHSLKYRNWRRLKDKVKDYITNGYESLISKMYANENTVKITPEAGEWLVARFMSKIEIVTIEQLHAEYNVIADERGWKK